MVRVLDPPGLSTYPGAMLGRTTSERSTPLIRFHAAAGTSCSCTRANAKQELERCAFRPAGGHCARGTSANAKHELERCAFSAAVAIALVVRTAGRSSGHRVPRCAPYVASSLVVRADGAGVSSLGAGAAVVSPSASLRPGGGDPEAVVYSAAAARSPSLFGLSRSWCP